jgi:hypothetical protein
MKKTFILLILILNFSTLFGQQFYVSPTGNDKNVGSFSKPFATLSRAKEAVRLTQNRKDTIKVFLRNGVYTLSESFVLNQEDGGTEKAPILYSAYENESVIIRGSKGISKNNIKKVSDKSTLLRIKPSLRDSVVEIDLAKLYIKNIKTYPDLFNDNGGIIDLFMDNERMPLSRYPNNDFMTMKSAIINGGGQESKNESWADYYGENSKKPKLPPRQGVFEYRDDRHNSWVKNLERGVWLKGYWRIPWQNEAVRVAEIDTIKRTVKLAVPVPGGIGNKYKRPEGNGKEPYVLMNLLEEIDQKGEWAIDFKDQKLYFYPTQKISDNNVRIADLQSPLIQINNASNIIIQGITLEENLGDGIKIIEGTNNLVAGCTIRKVTKYAVVFEKGKQNTVQSCDLYNLGAGGVWLSGGDENSSPRVGANHKVFNNHIYHFGVIERIYAPSINVGFSGGGGGGHHVAVGMKVSNNLLHDGPHAGVLFGSWDSKFEYNEVFDYCQVSDDVGAFYSYDKFEYMGNITFAYNFIHNSPIGDGIYFDHDHRDMKVYGNIVALCSEPKRRGTAFLYKIGSQKTFPQNIACYNNIAINSNYGYQFVTASPKNKIENNVSVRANVPYNYQFVKEKAVNSTDSLASGKNVTYTKDPGFENYKNFDFRLKKDSPIFTDLPDFQPIPFEKIGLYLDKYRKKLPTDADIKRFEVLPAKDSKGTEILDRN